MCVCGRVFYLGVSSVGQGISGALVCAWLDQDASGCGAVFGSGSKVSELEIP